MPLKACRRTDDHFNRGIANSVFIRLLGEGMDKCKSVFCPNSGVKISDVETEAAIIELRSEGFEIQVWGIIETS